LLVALGLLFGGLVSGAVVLLLRGAFPARPTPAAALLRPLASRPSPPPVVAPTPLPPAVLAPLPVVPAATVDPAVAPDPVDAAVVEDDRHRRRSRHRSTHRSTHRRHRHRHDPAD